jgi:hypothetical protein
VFGDFLTIQLADVESVIVELADVESADVKSTDVESADVELAILEKKHRTSKNIRRLKTLNV